MTSNESLQHILSSTLQSVNYFLESLARKADEYHLSFIGSAHSKETFRAVEEKLMAPLQVMIAGAFSTGKSSLINALFGQELAAVGALPTTAVISKFVYGSNGAVNVHFKDGHVRSFTTEQYGVLTSQETAWNSMHAKIDYVEYALPFEFLKEINIIDSPGLEAVYEYHADITSAFFKQADVVLWVISADTPLTSKEMAYIKDIKTRENPVVLVNKIDMVDEEEDSVDDVLDDVRRKLKSNAAAVFGVSAKQALMAKQTNNDNLLKESGLHQVEEYIRTAVIDQVITYRMDTLLDCMALTLLMMEDFYDRFHMSSLAEPAIHTSDMDAYRPNGLTYYEPEAGDDIYQFRSMYLQMLASVMDYCEERLLLESDSAFALVGILQLCGYRYHQNRHQGQLYLEFAASEGNVIAKLILFNCFKTISFNFWNILEFLTVAEDQQPANHDIYYLPDVRKALYWLESLGSVHAHTLSPLLQDTLLQARLWLFILYARTGKMQHISDSNLYKALIEEKESGHYGSSVFLGVLDNVDLLGEAERKNPTDYYRLGASQNCPFAIMMLALIALSDHNKREYVQWRAKLNGIHNETILLYIIRAFKDADNDDFITESDYLESAEELIKLRVGSVEDELLYVYNYGMDGKIPYNLRKLESLCLRFKDHNQRARTFYAEICLHNGREAQGLQELNTLAYGENYKDAKDALFLYYKNIDNWMDYPQYVEGIYRYCIDEVNDPGTQYIIATLFYSDCKPIKLDLDKARYWLEKSANAGFGRACYELGECYARGGGGYTQNLKLAEMYTQKAIDDGIEEAHKIMDFINFVR